MWEQIYATTWTNLISMGPLILCSILMLAIILERLIMFRPSKLYQVKQFDHIIELVSKNKSEEAIQLTANSKTLQGEIIHKGLVDRFQKNVLPEVAFLDHGLSRLDILAKWTSTLSFLAKIAPLFGLLGTVLGMIVAFEVIAKTAGNGEVKPQDVAEGIGTALLTTAAGLIVALPALIANSIITEAGQSVYNKFESSLQSLTIACGGLKLNESKITVPTETPINLIKNEEFANV